MTPLGRKLLARIEAGGPMPLPEFMAACLTDPDHGYYTTQDPLGAQGDFITAPEISQMFGEMIGLWFAQMWLDAGAPPRITLLELGPGRGTLMADLLRAASAVPQFARAIRPVFLDVSPTLASAQTAAVPDARHIQTLDPLPRDLPLFVLANEFFDALPIRQFQRIADGWAERRVVRDGDMLTLRAGQPLPNGALDQRFPAVPDGTIVEVNARAEQLIAELAPLSPTFLVLDYGDWAGTGDTLQALRQKQPADPLAAPGEADLTTHVSFAPLARAAQPLKAHFTTQGEFLERLGITARAEALATRGDYATIAAQHRRLTHPGEMGTLFKVLALSRGADTPPGFAT